MGEVRSCGGDVAGCDRVGACEPACMLGTAVAVVLSQHREGYGCSCGWGKQEFSYADFAQRLDYVAQWEAHVGEQVAKALVAR